MERSEDKELVEKQKAIEELEMVKQARLESLTVIENMELERPSSRLLIKCFYCHLLDHCLLSPFFRMEEQKRMEAQKELEEIKRSRNLAALDIQFNEETLKVILSKKRQYLKAPL